VRITDKNKAEKELNSFPEDLKVTIGFLRKKLRTGHYSDIKLEKQGTVIEGICLPDGWCAHVSSNLIMISYGYLKQESKQYYLPRLFFWCNSEEKDIDESEIHLVPALGTCTCGKKMSRFVRFGLLINSMTESESLVTRSVGYVGLLPCILIMFFYQFFKPNEILSLIFNRHHECL